MWGANFVGDGVDADGHGHGTHCAGTVAGATFGLAKKATVVAVKVLGADGGGTNAGVIAGVQWAAADAAGKRAVASMSLGGSRSEALNAAVAAAVAAGLPVVVAAGNSNADAADYSPASEPSAITVGATAADDARAYYSNYGEMLDVFAPGSAILSAYIGESNNVTKTLSGTSMAAPHVAGVAAYLLGMDESLTTPALLTAKILELAQVDTVTDTKGSPNKLLYNGSGF